MLNGDSNLEDNLRFFEFVSRHTVRSRKIHETWIMEMPSQAPVEDPSEAVAVFSCGGPYASGLYRIRDFSSVVTPFKPLTDDKEALIQEASMILLDSSCHPDLTPEKMSQFTSVVPRQPFQIWARK